MTTTTFMDPKPGLSAVVDRDVLAHSFDEISAAVRDPNMGLFGPDSMTWRLVKPLPVLPLALIQAGLLEAPHPYVAFGTMDSEASRNFIARFHRSIDAFWDWFCGDLEAAFKAARKVHGYHARVNGSIPEPIGRYEGGHHFEANEQEALIWVWATIIKPIKEVYERFHGRLPAADVERYYDESRFFALLFGIDQALLPTTWADFVDYFDGYVESGALDLSQMWLDHNDPGRATSAGSLTRRLIATWLLAIQAHMLPASVRRQYPTLPYGVPHQLVAAGSLTALRVAWALTPNELRDWPRCRTAFQRVSAAGPPGRLGRWLADKLPAPYSVS